ncbi:MAG: hypothetical protein HY319_06045 [Armatimonadetes bacterium]|nr:hypothetical protein [Armatimonadota bacterium]
MEELKDVRSGGNMLEKLMRKIPGFGGYLDRERRRDADKLQREFLARETIEIKKRLQDIQEELLANGNLSLMTKLDRLGNRLDRVSERIRTGASGYAAFFEINQVNSQELDRIYEHDLAMLTDLEDAKAACASLQTAVECEDNPGARVNDLQKLINQLDEKLNERERILKGVS